MLQHPEAHGELLTRITIWISLFFYVLTLATFYVSRTSESLDSTARLFWTAACAALVIHVGFAYHYYHEWSHASAYAETAVQTKQVYGLYWGGGVFVNYALMVGWIVDVSWWWLRGVHSYRLRPKAVTIAWHAFLFFIFFNATVVFEGGVLRWLGLLFTVAAVVALLLRLRPNRGTEATRVPVKQ